MNDCEDDYERPCPACGNPFTRWRHCGALGCEDGYIDMHEYDDPLWYDPGDTEMCSECSGTGIELWCPGCGRDMALAERLQDAQP